MVARQPFGDPAADQARRARDQYPHIPPPLASLVR
jgi:hypothetical protein